MNEKLNLGCGKHPKKGFINADLRNYPLVDLKFDLNKTPYPLESNKYELVTMDYVLEHLDDIPKIIEEVFRILKPNGKFTIISPHYASFSRYIDPTHKHGFSYFYFNYFNNEHYRGYQFKCNFKTLKKELIFPKHLFLIKHFANRFPGFFETNLCYIFRPSYLKITLMADKSS